MKRENKLRYCAKTLYLHSKVRHYVNIIIEGFALQSFHLKGKRKGERPVDKTTGRNPIVLNNFAPFILRFNKRAKNKASGT